MEKTSEYMREALDEVAAVREERARRDAELDPSERLARVDELCRQLAAIRPVSDTDD